MQDLQLITLFSPKKSSLKIIINYLFMGIFCLYTTSLFCQNPILNGVKNQSGSTTLVEKNRIYVNANLKPVAKNQASYYLVKRFVRRELKTTWIPNYEGYSLPKVEGMGISNYQYNYFFLNNQLAYSAEVLVNEKNPNHYEFSGRSIWYNKDGTLLAEGTLLGGVLDGIYKEYHKNGKIKTQKRYVRGKEFNTAIYKPLLGKWVMVLNKKNSTYNKEHVYNTYYEDGTMTISVRYVSTKSNLGYNKSGVDTFLWKCIPNKYGGATLEFYYPDGRLLQKGKLKFQGNQMISTVSEHQNSAVVGERYIFSRMK